MHGVYFIIEPLFAIVLVLLSAAALYMGLFKAHRATASFGRKAFSGIASGALSCLCWFFMYSHRYLGW